MTTGAFHRRRRAQQQPSHHVQLAQLKAQRNQDNSKSNISHKHKHLFLLPVVNQIRENFD
jgi:hypothetical protein